MNKLRIGTLALVGATATGVIAFTAPAIADDASGLAYKRDDSSGKVITTADLDDDDDEASKSTNTGTHTNTGGGNNTNNGTNTGTRTRGGNTDNSRDRKVRDHTSDGPGSGNVDHTRGHTNDGTRHNTRG